MHKIRSLESLRRSPDPLVGWEGIGAYGASILPYHFYVCGAASDHVTLSCQIWRRNLTGGGVKIHRQ